MNANQLNNGRGYWLAWFLASIMGYGMGAVLGAIGGYFQWVVLRERIAGAGLWGLASALGLALAMGTSAAVNPAENPVMAGVLIASVFGAAGGILQWLILRRKVPRAGWWFLANLIGSLVTAIAVPIATAIGDAGNGDLGVLAFGLVFGTGNGAITGAVLIWLLRQSPSGDVEGLATVH